MHDGERWPRMFAVWIAVLRRVLALFFVIIGAALIYKGGNEAHIFNGIALNLNLSESTGEAKLIVGFGLLLFGLQVVTNRTRRRVRLRGDE